MIDQVLKEIGIEGGNLARMGGLMREASDMQRVAKDAAVQAKADSAAAEPKADGATPEPPAGGGRRPAPPVKKA